VYEIGALCALEEAIDGLDVTALAGYVGVSAGGFIAAGLANGLSPRQMCTSFIESRDEGDVPAIDPGIFVRLAWREYLRRSTRLPRLAVQAAHAALVEGRPWLSAAERLGSALPTGLFSHAPIEQAIRRLLTTGGRSNRFADLQRRLVLVATDLDTGTAAPFGLPGWDDVPISQAVAASAALPGLFPPVHIQGRSYVDGALKKTLHARVLLDLGLDLVICLNPLVPFNATESERHRLLAGGVQRLPSLEAGGLPLVMSQTFRTLIHSRLELGMHGYRTSHPGTDVLLFEPDQRDPALFTANTFTYGERRHIAEHAYQRTRADLRSRRNPLSRQLARHGLALNHAALDDAQRRLLAVRSPRRGTAAQTLQRLDEVLSDLEGVVGVAR
jgi:NTE family protein